MEGCVSYSKEGWAGIRANLDIDYGDAKVSESGFKALLISNGEELVTRG